MRDTVLLAAVNSQYLHSNPVLYALKRSAEQAGCGDLLETADLSINMPLLRVMEDIYVRQPRVLAFSMYIWNVDYVAQLLDGLRKLLPDTLILMGGPEAGARPEYYLQTMADGVCIGQGELVFGQYLQAFRQGEMRPALAGLMWRGREEEYKPALKPDLAGLPFLYTDEELAALSAANKAIYYESSRGCPFGCAFCASATEPLQERPLDTVLDELPRLAAAGGQIKLVDRTFNAEPERAIAITRRALELCRPGLSWHFEISPFSLRPGLTELWLAAPKGYFHLEIGVQSLHQPALKAIGRQGDWTAAEPTVKELIAAGNCHVHLDLIAGLPEDGPETFAASFHRLHQLNADYLQLGFLKILPGSPLSARAEALGLVAEGRPPYRILAAPGFSAEYLFRLFRAERLFNALYNRGDLRSTLLEKAEKYPGGALDMYFRAAELHPGLAGLSQGDKEELAAAL